MKEILVNKKALHQYHILETWEAGIALSGTEVKSIRERNVSLDHAYVRPEKGVLMLVGSYIARYPPAGPNNHNPERPRKLLLHRQEINHIVGYLSQKGLTIVPLRLYFKDSRIKVEIALVRGKKLFDKREEIKRREEERQISRALKTYYKFKSRNRIKG